MGTTSFVGFSDGPAAIATRRGLLLHQGIPAVHVTRRLGVPPRDRRCTTGETCPDLFELSDGNFAVMGTEATATLESSLPPDVARADYERIVIISRETLIRAKRDIPDA